VLRGDAQLLAGGEPPAQLVLPPSAYDEHSVLGVLAQTIQHRDDLTARRPVDGVLRHHGAVVVQENQPVIRPPIRRDNVLHGEAPEIRAKGHHLETHAEADPPMPAREMVLAGALQVRVEGPRPVGDVVGAHVLVVLLVPQPLLGLRHPQRGVHGLRHGLHAPRVDADRAAQGRGATDELREHDDAPLGRVVSERGALLPAHRVDVGDPVEPVADGADDAALGSRVVGGLLLRRHRGVDEHDRRVPGGAETRIDPGADGPGLVLHALHVAPLAARRVGDLHEHGAAAELPVLHEQLLHRQELEPDPLEQIDVVDADHEAPSLVRLGHPPHRILRLRRRDHRSELAHVDPDGENLDRDGAAVVLDADVAALGLVVESEQPRAGGQEVPRVVEGVEADEVGVEEGADEVIPHGDGAEDLRRGER
jgi:hypothetical protein